MLFFVFFSISNFGIAQNVETIQLGDQVWMKYNLKKDVLGSICYEKDSVNCEKYGRLYFWQAALDVCPNGFRLPTDEDWTVLTDYLGGEGLAGKKLKKNGDSGFDAELAGNYHPDVKLFSFEGERGYYWTATPHGYNTAWIRSFQIGDDKVTRTTIGKSFYFSVRCIKAD